MTLMEAIKKWVLARPVSKAYVVYLLMLSLLLRYVTSELASWQN